MRAVGFDLSRSPWSQYLVTFMSYIFLLYVRAFVLNQVRMCVCCFGHRVWWSNRRKSHFLLEIVFYHEKMRREEIADRWRRPLSCSALLFSSWLLVDGLQDSDDSENAARSKLCALFLTCWWSNAFSCLRFPTFFFESILLHFLTIVSPFSSLSLSLCLTVSCWICQFWEAEEEEEKWTWLWLGWRFGICWVPKTRVSFDVCSELLSSENDDDAWIFEHPCILFVN